jgi:predicted PurR-regulated permease PerM
MRSSVLLFTLLLCFFVVLSLSFLVFQHFLLVLAVAASAAILLAPVNERWVVLLKGRRSLAALCLVILTVLMILGPLTTLVLLIGNQAVALFDMLQPSLTPEAMASFWQDTLPSRFPWLADLKVRLQLDQQRIVEVISPALSAIASGATRFFQEAFARLAEAILQLTLFLFMLFFLLRDGRLLMEAVRGISPISEQQGREVYQHLARTVKGVLQSMVLVPLAQGLLAMIGFGVFGLPAPMFWGAILIFAAVIPGIGSPLVWLPAGIYLIASGAKWSGIGLLAYGTLVISTIDNILKPMILRGSARIHPLLGFLAILGGMLTFGLFGFLVGPIILSLLLSALRIYRMHVLTPPGADGGAPATSAGTSKGLPGIGA